MSQSPDDAAEIAQIKRTLSLFKRGLYATFGIIILGLLGWVGIAAYQHFKNNRQPPSPVPKSIRDSVSFSVYYPDQAKLPAGYNLDTGSFKSGGGAVLYNVNYPGNHKLHFSVQQKPSASDIQNFYMKNLPIHNTVTTRVGSAAVGVIGTQTFISLPTNGNDWIIITGPLDTNQVKLTQVMRAIKAPK